MSEHLLIDSVLDNLLQLGDPGGSRERRDYRALGVTAEHVPDLIRLMKDRSLNDLDEKDPRVWAPVHAWRALAQLKSQAAIEPFLEYLAAIENESDDWFTDDFSRCMGEIGPAAIPALTDWFRRKTEGPNTRSDCAGALGDMAKVYPEECEAIVRILTEELGDAELNDPEVNARIISELVELDVKEAAPLIESVMTQGLADERMSGSWAWVRRDLGLGPKPRGHRYPGLVFPFLRSTPAERAQMRSKERRREKKRLRQARKKNRRP